MPKVKGAYDARSGNAQDGTRLVISPAQQFDDDFSPDPPSGGPVRPGREIAAIPLAGTQIECLAPGERLPQMFLGLPCGSTPLHRLARKAEYVGLRRARTCTAGSYHVLNSGTATLHAGRERDAGEIR
jgi:hypothetical protein